MNNYFGIGLDAKISLDFNNKRDEHPEKCRSFGTLLSNRIHALYVQLQQDVGHIFQLFVFYSGVCAYVCVYVLSHCVILCVCVQESH